jgi:hypothetical protein
MTILKDVLSELFAMFVGDLRLTMLVLLVVALAAVLIGVVHANPLIGGAVLLFGCLAVVVGTVLRAASAAGR